MPKEIVSAGTDSIISLFFLAEHLSFMIHEHEFVMREETIPAQDSYPGG
jgi:hypothetical protein